MKILRFVGVSRFRRLKPSVSALLLMCLLAALPLPAFAAKKIIFDTDPGSDDALALMLALNSPELDVRAITVVPGNVTAAVGLENALRMVSLANRCDIPVAAGAQHPLFQKLITAEFWHGKNGLANVELAPSKCKVDSRFGPDLIIQLVHASPRNYSGSSRSAYQYCARRGKGSVHRSSGQRSHSNGRVDQWRQCEC